VTDVAQCYQAEDEYTSFTEEEEMKKSTVLPTLFRFQGVFVSAVLAVGVVGAGVWGDGAPLLIADGDDAVVAEEVSQTTDAETHFVISERAPWSEAVGVSEVPQEAQMNIRPAPLGPAPDGTFSVLVHLDPRMDRAIRANGAVSVVRFGVRDFVRRENARIQYEYDILPNVLNVRGLTARGVLALKLLPGVVKVEEDTEAHTYHNDSMPLIRAYQSQLQGAGFTGVDGAGVRICVVDTGIDSNSIMYSTRIDAAAGWDFVNNDSNPEDDNGHGSHCSGTALGGFVNADFACAATGPESMQGVAPAATLIGVKVLNSAGSGSFSNVIAGINRCASTTLPGGQADVISLSLGGGSFSSACDSDSAAIAVNNAFNAGVVVVVAAGNDAFTNAVGTPACASGAITVAAIYDDNYPNCDFPSQSSFVFSNCTDNNPVVNQRCCFSNRSPMLEVTAPGCIIFSDDSTVAAGNGLVGFCGTSQATPHVAGLAALLLDANPSLTPTQVRNHINNGAVDLGAAGFDNNFGWGRIDAINSLNLAAPPTGCTTDPQCDDGNACTNDTCVSGTCAHTAITCNDSNACTTDTCNPATGCVFTSITCNDSSLCTADTCNPATGCVFTPITCNDSNLCTTDTCAPATGCVFTPINCNDSNACTTDSCSGGVCSNVAITCNDGITCTTDSCNPASGCVFTWPACNLSDGCCGPVCTFPSDADCPGCQAAGTSCTANSQCCSNSCKGKPGAKKCK
jgi:subtilisin family serine protease